MTKETGFGDAAGVINGEEKSPMIVHCGECSHEWTLLYLPMVAHKASAMMKAARCPMDGSKNVQMGPAK